MVFAEVFQPFIRASAVSVMFRATLEHVFSGPRLDALFRKTAVKQHTGELLFSTCADLLSLVVLKIRKSVNAAYKVRCEQVGVTVKSIYDKLAGIEPEVSETLVRETAAELVAVIDHLGCQRHGPLPGFEVRILDGNHLAGTDHRIAELRGLGAAALPGETLCVLDPQRQLMLEVVTCENGHTNERVLIPAVLERVQAGQCWIADSLFCTLEFLFGIRAAHACFLVRQHAQLQGELQGKRRRRGRCSTGVVYEQEIQVRRHEGTVTTVRRLTILRDKPGKSGAREINLLTNLPLQVSAVKAAETYLSRWSIETAFLEVTTTLRCEINTLGYPKAALFGFCLALMIYNMMSTVKAAIRAGAKGTKEQRANVSTYYLADEISGVARGMAIAIPERHWHETFATRTPVELATCLRGLAKHVNLDHFQTNPWKPKKSKTPHVSGNRGNHVSTFEILLHRYPADSKSTEKHRKQPQKT